MVKSIALLTGALLLSLACATARAAPARIVLGYSASWFDDRYPVDFYNYDSLTYLARSFLTPHPDGSIQVPANYFNTTMQTMARKHGVKLLMSLGGEADNADNWLSIARHPQYMQRFSDELAKLLTDHGYDGIDIDWEPSPLTTEDGLAYTSLLKTLRQRFPKAIITTALGASEYWISHFSWRDICDNVDYVNVMVYDYSGGWGGRAAYASNLFPPGAYPPQPDFSVDQGMNNLIHNHNVPPAKLLLGVTFWASRFAVHHIGDAFPVNGPDYSMNITYAQTMSLLQSGAYTEFWDEKAAMPYLQKAAGGSVVCYENAKSIQRKCDYADKLGCAGVMIWHVGADIDGDHAPLMDAVAQSCGAPAETLGRAALQAQIAAASPSSSDLSKSTDVQLQNVLAHLQSDWTQSQEKQWQIQASQRGKKMN